MMSRFSLRALIIVTAFVAIAIAWYADRRRLGEELNSLTHSIESLTGKANLLTYENERLTKDGDALRAQVRNLWADKDSLSTKILELESKVASEEID